MNTILETNTKEGVTEMSNKIASVLTSILPPKNSYIFDEYNPITSEYIFKPNTNKGNSPIYSSALLINCINDNKNRDLKFFTILTKRTSEKHATIKIRNDVNFYSLELDAPNLIVKSLPSLELGIISYTELLPQGLLIRTKASSGEYSAYDLNRSKVDEVPVITKFTHSLNVKLNELLQVDLFNSHEEDGYYVLDGFNGYSFLNLLKSNINKCDILYSEGNYVVYYIRYNNKDVIYVTNLYKVELVVSSIFDENDLEIIRQEYDKINKEAK